MSKREKETYPYLEASFIVSVIPMMTKNIKDIVLNEEKSPENFGKDDPFEPISFESESKGPQKFLEFFVLLVCWKRKKKN